MIAAFKTTDAFEKVYDYYKQQLPADAEKMKVSSANGSVVSFQTGGEKHPTKSAFRSRRTNRTKRTSSSRMSSERRYARDDGTQAPSP